MNRKWAIISGPLSAAIIWAFTDLQPDKPAVTLMAGVTVWMALWWLTEAVHLAVTSLLPFVLLPILQITDTRTVAFQYMDPVIFLFIGGFLLAFALEKHGLHHRIALGILSKVGRSPAAVLSGVMLTAWFLSMWISNTATVMMLLAAVLAISKILDEQNNGSGSQKMNAALLIGLAYAATIGGMATLVGTPPNMVFMRFMTETYQSKINIGFVDWFVIGFPISLALLILCFLILRNRFLRNSNYENFNPLQFLQMKKTLGKPGRDQKMVILIFSLTVVLWFTRSDLLIGTLKIPGWSSLIHSGEYIQDSTVAVFMAVLLFLIPSSTEKGSTLLTWNEAGKMPFDIILLFGSGFALAKGFEVSGLSNWLANHLIFLKGVPVWLVTVAVVSMVCLISEFASNVASIQLVLPILISLQEALGLNELVLTIPATLAASLGFMLPVATAPNTIVFGTGGIKLKQMLKTGFWMDFAGIIVISIICIIIL